MDGPQTVVDTWFYNSPTYNTKNPDGSEWQTDPRADRYQDDGFGNRNAVLAVTSGA